ncbi:Zinc finger protein 701 [Plecturocebus cupreus]
MGFLHVGQAGLELLTLGDPPVSASQSAGITHTCDKDAYRMLMSGGMARGEGGRNEPEKNLPAAVAAEMVNLVMSLGHCGGHQALTVDKSHLESMLVITCLSSPSTQTCCRSGAGEKLRQSSGRIYRYTQH